MITNYELDEINRMSVDDPGMKDLLDRLHEYYLLKRPTPISHSTTDILSRIRARQMSPIVKHAPAAVAKPTTLKEIAAFFAQVRELKGSNETE